MMKITNNTDANTKAKLLYLCKIASEPDESSELRSYELQEETEFSNENYEHQFKKLCRLDQIENISSLL